MQVNEADLAEVEADYSSTQCALFARYDLDSSSWKTSGLLWEEDLPESSVRLPKAGMMRSGQLYRHGELVRLTSGKDAGLWPTPTTDHYQRNTLYAQGGMPLSMAVTLWATPIQPNGGRSVANVTDWRGSTAYNADGKKVQVDLQAQLKMWATPTATDGKRASASTNGADLPRDVHQFAKMWATPTATDGTRGDCPSERSRNTPGLVAQASQFSAASPAGSNTCGSTPTTPGDVPFVSEVMTEQSGPLSPEFHCWLMGYPAGFNDCVQPATRSSGRSRRRSGGRSKST